MATKPANPRMKIKDIAEKYHGEVVLLDLPMSDRNGQTKSGIVVAHSSDIDEVYKAMADLKLRHSAILSFVPFPEDTSFVF